MTTRVSDAVLQALAITAEVIGCEMSEQRAAILCNELAQYPEQQVLGALARCKNECRYRLALADVLDRLDDGRPGAEEAWAMVPKTELDSALMTEGEMNVAWGAALPLIEARDMVAARMAFKQAYEPLVATARAEHRPVQWFASLGHDVVARVPVIEAALRLGRIDVEQAQRLLPQHDLRDWQTLTEPTPVGKLLADLRLPPTP